MGVYTTRRAVLTGAAVLVSTRAVLGTEKTARARKPDSELAALEKRAGGRLGVVAINTATGQRAVHRADERFAMCSTFKCLLAAAILQRVDQGVERLDQKIEYGESDLLENAQASKEHLKDGGMTVAQMCAAAVEQSDNTAANLLLKSLGGPKALTGFIRTLGDDITRVDNYEPVLNAVGPGQVHDTTSPASMVGLLSTVLFGQVLAPASRSQLERWMLDVKIGEHRIPAGLPPGWQIGHKTGTWSNQTNDVGAIWPPNRAPIVIAVYYQRGDVPQEEREGVLRDVGRIVATSL